MRLADHARPEGPAARRPWPSTPSTSPARASPSSSPATPPTARDAIELVLVDYDDLPAVLDMEAAVAEGATLVHADLGTNASAHWVFDSGRGRHRRQDADGDRRRRGRPRPIVVQPPLPPAAADPRVHGAALRRRRPDRRAVTHLVGDADPAHPKRLHGRCSPACPEHKLRVIAPDVGGGFGGKLQVTPEEMLASSRRGKLGKPVKYTETRSESLLSAHHGRDQIQDITLAAKRDGTVTGAQGRAARQHGRLPGPGRRRAIPILGAFMFNSIYKFPAYRFECTNVFTNKTPTDAYRGAGRPEATFAIERIDGRAGRRAGPRPDGVRAAELDQARGVPVHHGRAG